MSLYIYMDKKGDFLSLLSNCPQGAKCVKYITVHGAGREEEQGHFKDEFTPTVRVFKVCSD